MMRRVLHRGHLVDMYAGACHRAHCRIQDRGDADKYAQHGWTSFHRPTLSQASPGAEARCDAGGLRLVPSCYRHQVELPSSMPSTHDVQVTHTFTINT